MTDIFLRVFDMSVVASYAILVVLAARLVLKKAPKIFSCSLWLIVLFRLVCPVSFKSVFSFLRPISVPVPAASNVLNTPIDASNIAESTSNASYTIPKGDTNIIVPLANTVDVFQIVLSILSIVWIVGICAMLVYSIVSYVRLRRSIALATKVDDNIYECSSIDSPFVLGILRPTIYLPTGLSQSERIYIIEHEKTHIKRLDYIIKPLSYLALCLHWFNPLVWISFKLMTKDMEMSCDEKVISNMGNDIKKEYSYSLLSFATGRRMMCGSPLAFGENTSQSRIKNVLSYKKPSFWIIIVAIILVIVLGVGLLTNPSNRNDNATINFDGIIKSIEQRSQIMVITSGGGGTILSGETILGNLSVDKWKAKNVSSPYELSSDMTIYLDDREETSIQLYETDNIAMVLKDGGYQYYDIPDDTFKNLQMRSLLSSYFLIKELADVITSGKMTNGQSVNETPVGVESYKSFRIGNGYYYVYEKNGKCYCESPYNYIKEISKKVYEDAQEFLVEPQLNDSQQNNDQAEAKTHDVVPAVWTKDTSVGADMATLDYASNDIVIFHGYFGLFVYDLKRLEIVRSINLGIIGCDATQGDNYCEVEVSADGNIVQLHPMSSDNMFVYNVANNTLVEQPYVELADRYKDYMITSEVVDTGTLLTYSYKAIPFGNDTYGYLFTSDWTLGTLEYVKKDMVYKLFE